MAHEEFLEETNLIIAIIRALMSYCALGSRLGRKNLGLPQTASVINGGAKIEICLTRHVL